VVEDLDATEVAAIPAQTPDSRLEEPGYKDIRLFYCVQCRSYVVPEDGNEWPVCATCRKVRLKCEVQVNRILCHFCETWFANTNDVRRHIEVAH